jgi:hypothetical protein
MQYVTHALISHLKYSIAADESMLNCQTASITRVAARDPDFWIRDGADPASDETAVFS